MIPSDPISVIFPLVSESRWSNGTQTSGRIIARGGISGNLETTGNRHPIIKETRFLYILETVWKLEPWLMVLECYRVYRCYGNLLSQKRPWLIHKDRLLLDTFYLSKKSVHWCWSIKLRRSTETRWKPLWATLSFVSYKNIGMIALMTLPENELTVCDVRM